MSADASDSVQAPPELRAMQRLLRALVTAPTGIGPALEGRAGVPGWLDEWPDPDAALAATVRGDDQLDAAARLDVYAQGYFARLHEVLEDDYPTVAWLCGEAAFNDIVTAYLVAHPSASPTLRDLGRAFADFLAGHPVTAFAREGWPGVADVARLEWAFAEVFDARDACALEREQLAAWPHERWAEIDLEAVPAFAVLTFDRPVGDFVAAQRRGDAPPALASPSSTGPAAGPHTIAVWREGERAVYRRIEPLEAEALHRVACGDTFGHLCEWLAGRTAGDDEAAATAASWLARWVADGWLKSLPEAAPLR